MKKVTLRISSSLYEGVMTEAQQKGISMALVLRRRLNDWLPTDKARVFPTSNGEVTIPVDVPEEARRLATEAAGPGLKPGKISFIKALRDLLDEPIGLKAAKEVSEYEPEFPKGTWR